MATHRAGIERRGIAEGLNPLYWLGGTLWLLLSRSYPSLRLRRSLPLLKRGLSIFEDQLNNDLKNPYCMRYPALIRRGYLKKKHWVYACYMAVMSSLPLLHKVCDRGVILEAVLGKTAIGTSTKLLDNLNDTFHTADRAIEALEEFKKAMMQPDYILPLYHGHIPKIAQAENSSFIIGNWVPRILVRCLQSEMYRTYVRDVEKLIEGQIESIRHKASGGVSSRSVRDYLASISEKSIGDVWLDVDLCFLEYGVEHLDKETFEAVLRLKAGYSLIFKSTLIYDDVQDLAVDLDDEAVNIAVLLGLEEGCITPQDVVNLPVKDIVGRLELSGVVSDTIHLADMVFLKGIRELEQASEYRGDIIDWGGLILNLRFVRLFNLRKILVRKRNIDALKLFTSSLRDFKKLESAIPDHIYRFERSICSR